MHRCAAGRPAQCLQDTAAATDACGLTTLSNDVMVMGPLFQADQKPVHKQVVQQADHEASASLLSQLLWLPFLQSRSFNKQSMKPVPFKELQPLVQHFSGWPPQAPGCDNAGDRRQDSPVAIDYIHSAKCVWPAQWPVWRSAEGDVWHDASSATCCQL